MKLETVKQFCYVNPHMGVLCFSSNMLLWTSNCKRKSYKIQEIHIFRLSNVKAKNILLEKYPKMFQTPFK